MQQAQFRVQMVDGSLPVYQSDFATQQEAIEAAEGLALGARAVRVSSPDVARWENKRSCFVRVSTHPA